MQNNIEISGNKKKIVLCVAEELNDSKLKNEYDKLKHTHKKNGQSTKIKYKKRHWHRHRHYNMILYCVVHGEKKGK